MVKLDIHSYIILDDIQSKWVQYSQQINQNQISTNTTQTWTFGFGSTHMVYFLINKN